MISQIENGMMTHMNIQKNKMKLATLSVLLERLGKYYMYAIPSVIQIMNLWSRNLEMHSETEHFN